MTPAHGALEQRCLGKSGLCVSVLGLGAAPFGGMYERSSDTAAVETVRAALKSDITLFDVAPHYGQGLAEHRLGHGLAQMRPDGYVVSTKVGRLLHPAADPPSSTMWPEALPFTTVYDVSPAGILGSLRDSRRQVGRDTFEILLLHDPDRYADTPATLRRLISEAYGTLSALREEGQVKAIGIGANSPEVGLAALELGHWDCFLLAGTYSVLEQNDQGLLDRCARSSVSVLIGGPYMSGALAGGTTWRYRPIPTEIAARIAGLRDICRDHRIPLQAAALQFPLLHPGVASVIVGMRSADEVGQNVAFLRYPIPDGFWASLLAEGFIAERRSPARGHTS